MSDLHRHPLSTCGVVTAGRFTFQLEGEPARVLRTGDDNASSTEPAEIVCFYLTDSNRTAMDVVTA